MCGRYELNLSDDNKSKQIKQRAEKLNLIYKEGEIFPNDDVLCMIANKSKIDLSVMKWGIKSKAFQINARLETINDRNTYDEFKNNRCAVICNGFYEWDKDKNKYFVKTSDDIIYLACIFNSNNELLIITKAAGDNFKSIHDRMPIIMNQEEMLKYIHNEDYIFSNKKLIIENVDDDIKLF